MKVVIFSSNSNYFDGNLFHYYNYPTNTQNWENFLNQNPDVELIFVSELPGMFLFDVKNNQLLEKSNKITYFIQKPESNFIASLNPDLIISASFWVTPFDWLPIADSIIAEELKNAGFNVIANSVSTSSICFDKNLTHNFLETNNFNIAKSVYVHHELFWAERNHSEIKENIYKKNIFYQIKKLKLPLIIKDTIGLSSYGMEVVTTYNQAIGFLNSKKNNGDKIVEEFISGLQFGTEIHGNCQKGYKIHNPFLFSVNQYGITSPKQSIKLGPVNSAFFKIEELNSELTRLAKCLNINGIAQVDLVFNENEKKWYIIEINPRLSGMTHILLESTKTEEKLMALKLPVLDEKQLDELKKIKFIKHISQVRNDAAKQRRECGYCEIIFTYTKENREINLLKEKFPDLIDINFYNTALKMNKIIDL